VGGASLATLKVGEAHHARKDVSICVCVCVCACAHVCAHVCVHACVCTLLPLRRCNGVHNTVLEQTLLKQV